MKSVLYLFSVLMLASAQHANTVEDTDTGTDGDAEPYYYRRRYVESFQPLPQPPVSPYYERFNSQIEAILKKECDRYGSGTAFQQIKVTMKDLVTCTQTVLSTIDMPRTRDVGSIVRKICSVTPQLMSCFHKYLDSAKVCMAPDEKANLHHVHNATDALTDYLCYEEGNRITSFLLEGGASCVMAKKDEVKNCANSTVLKDQPEENEVWSQRLKDEKCKKISGFQNCIKEELEECPQRTAASFVDGLINSIKNVSC